MQNSPDSAPTDAQEARLDTLRRRNLALRLRLRGCLYLLRHEVRASRRSAERMWALRELGTLELKAVTNTAARIKTRT